MNNGGGRAKTSLTCKFSPQMLLQDKSSLPLIFRHRAISRHFLWRQKEKKGLVEIAGSRDRIDLTIEEAGKKVNQSVKRDGEDGRSWRGGERDDETRRCFLRRSYGRCDYFF